MSTIVGNGIAGSTGDGGPAIAARLNNPFGVAIAGSGNLFIADRGNYRVREVFLVEPDCLYSIDPSVGPQIPFTGGAFAVRVEASAPTCRWTVRSDMNWLPVVSGATGTGNGVVNYSADPSRTLKIRTGTLTLAGHTLKVTQAGVPTCQLSMSPKFDSIGVAGASARVATVTANATECPWIATTTASWIALSGARNGTGDGSIEYTVFYNSGLKRRGSILIGNESLDITQSGIPAVVSFGAFSPAALTAGQPYLVPVRVTSATSVVPTGAVAVSDGTSTCTVGLSEGTGACTLTSSGGTKTISALSGVNYFFGLTTTISPDQRQLLCSS